jgi:hypothetical protein
MKPCYTDFPRYSRAGGYALKPRKTKPAFKAEIRLQTVVSPRFLRPRIVETTNNEDRLYLYDKVPTKIK